MKQLLSRQGIKIIALTCLTLGMIFLFLTYHTYGNWEFALQLRGKKLLAFVIVGILTSFSTITFQTISQNHFLTPSILGFDSLYVLIQTILFFVIGNTQQGNPILFVLNIIFFLFPYVELVVPFSLFTM